MSSIKDVARLAGVSTATVSRTLSEPDKVSEETRNKVHAAIRRTGYVANALARNFRTRRTQTVLVLVPDIGNAFYSSIIQGLEEVGQRHGYRILLGDTQNSTEREAELVQSVLQRQADGVVSLGSTVPALADEHDIPVVMACEYLRDDSVPSVCIDNVGAAAEATSHLLALGHRRIAYIDGPARSPLSKDRLKGYRQALQRSGIGYSAELTRRGDFSLQSGERAAAELLAAGAAFTAIFAANDAMAIGAIKVLRKARIAVPKQVSVVGFDDIEFSDFVDPPLTTIHQPRREIGRAVMETLIALLQDGRAAIGRGAGGRIHGGRIHGGRVVLDHQLVVRQSTGPAPADKTA